MHSVIQSTTGCRLARMTRCRKPPTPVCPAAGCGTEDQGLQMKAPDPGCLPGVATAAGPHTRAAARPAHREAWPALPPDAASPRPRGSPALRHCCTPADTILRRIMESQDVCPPEPSNRPASSAAGRSPVRRSNPKPLPARTASFQLRKPLPAPCHHSHTHPEGRLHPHQHQFGNKAVEAVRESCLAATHECRRPPRPLVPASAAAGPATLSSSGSR
mmetsp:Transcript_6964/g.18006  ORF Transcript_6964/g.18006 Transcript_6964/m.18006 type:complete len:217 (-) Transcript_6964:612-1262(-)